MMPGYNGDTLGYLGVVMEYKGGSKEEVHKAVYKTLQEEAPEKKFIALTTQNDYLKKCHSDIDFFHDKLSFYRVKPLYTISIYLLHSLGVKVTHAMIFISVLSFWGILVLSFFWLKEYLPENHAGIVMVGLSFFYPIIVLGRMFTPDALSNFLILMCFYFFIKKIESKWWYLFLGLAVLTRIDNLVTVTLLLFFFIFQKYFSKKFILQKKQLIYSISLLVIGAAVVATLTYLVGNSFDWLWKFTHTFSLQNYLNSWKTVPDDIIRYSSFPLITLFLILTFPLIVKQDKILILLIFGIIFCRLILFPSFQERFFVAFEIIIFILIAKSIFQNQYFSSTKLK